MEETWGLHLFNDSSILVQAVKGKMVIKKGIFKIKIITLKDDGKVFISKPEEMFRTALPMDDDMD